ncbi:PqqD family protein [Niabella aquatica]
MNYRFNAADVLITQLGNEGVAFNSATNEYFSLNETSFKILKGLENNTSAAEIKKQLENEYNVPADECEKAVNSTIQIFLAKKLVIEA